MNVVERALCVHACTRARVRPCARAAPAWVYFLVIKLHEFSRYWHPSDGLFAGISVFLPPFSHCVRFEEAL